MPSFLVLEIYLLLLLLSSDGKRAGEVVFFMAALLKMGRQLRRQHPHQYDDMETFIFGRRHQGGDGVAAME